MVLFASSASCKSTGARITVCAVDVANSAFQCSDNGERQFEMPFEKGYNLECSSPEDTEYFLKACKRGEIVEVTECRYKDEEKFFCVDVTNQSFDMPISLMDNYFCLTPQNRKRVIDRCRSI